MILSKHISSVIQKGRRIVKVLCFGKSDVRTAYEVAPYGTDSQAPKDTIAIYADTSNNGERIVVGYINKQQLAQVGEHRTFSTDQNGEMKFYIWQKNDGTCEIGGDADHMVRYSKLEEAFNELKQDFNNLVSTFNSHIHTTTATIGSSATPGVISSPTSSGQSSSADITPAKIEEIKTI